MPKAHTPREEIMEFVEGKRKKWDIQSNDKEILGRKLSLTMATVNASNLLNDLR